MKVANELFTAIGFLLWYLVGIIVQIFLRVYYLLNDLWRFVIGVIIVFYSEYVRTMDLFHLITKYHFTLQNAHKKQSEYHRFDGYLHTKVAHQRLREQYP